MDLRHAINLRFAFLEKFFETTFYRYSLGSEYPIVDVKYTRWVTQCIGKYTHVQ